uniref:Uncharacterized protein n=1 Tax=Piliocolobus tephrosceles TaxID=591936 RepID=A0A8C9J1G5_9PRIM
MAYEYEDSFVKQLVTLVVNQEIYTHTSVTYNCQFPEELVILSYLLINFTYLSTVKMLQWKPFLVLSSKRRNMLI